MTITLIDCDLWICNMHTRMPFRYGIAELTAVPHLMVRATIDVDGRRGVGISADNLAPKWFTKDPNESYAHELAAMFEVITHAIESAIDRPASSPFALWHQLYRAQSKWAATTTHPPLLWNFGVSLVERAIVDAFCRTMKLTFDQALRDNAFGIDLGAIHPELAGAAPADLLPPARRRVLPRHTVGLSDPLFDRDIPPAERLDDGLPQSLEQVVAEYGLTHYKIKLCGDVNRDLARLAQIAEVLAPVGNRLRFTLDGNEQFHDVETFKRLWDQLHAAKELSAFLSHLLFVEQPFYRGVALSDAVREEMLAWTNRPPMIIDESDASLDSLPRALACGYVGTSHKNCKGVFKGIACASLIARLRQKHPDKTFVHSAEDLTNVGPIALLQDLAVVGSLGIDHVERNGHHYFRGLTMWPVNVQRSTLAAHGDLYREHEDGYPTLAITHGEIEIGSVMDAPFGVGFEMDATRFTPAKEWKIESLATR